MQPRVRSAGWAGGIFVIALASLLLGGCSGEAEVPHRAETPLGALPPLPLDVPGHGVAVIQQTEVLGKDAFAKSPGALVQGDNLVLFASQSNPPALEWGIWRYTPDPGASEVAQSALFDLLVTAGNSAWLGIANYANGTWEFRGPFMQGGGGPSKDFGGLQLGDFLSPAGNLYFLAAAYNGTTCSVGGITVTSDADPPPPEKFSISGRLVDSATSQGIAGITITLNPGGLTKVTDNQGNYSFTDLSASPPLYDIAAPTVPGYDVVPAMGYIGISLGPDSTGNNFQATEQPPAGVTYETGEGIVKKVIDANCIICHSPGGPKGDKPLRTYAECETVGFEKIWTRVVAEKNMPPGGMPDSERDKIQAWKDNGYAQ